MKLILVHMARRPGQELGGNDFIPALSNHRNEKVNRRGVSGTFGAFGRRIQGRYGQADNPPYDKRWDYELKENCYRMPEAVAQIILSEA